MNCDDFFPGGITPDQAARIANIIVEAGIDCIEVTGGIPASLKFITMLDTMLIKEPDNEKKEAYFRSLGLAIKKAVKIPVILVGGLRSPKVMEMMIEEGNADFVSISRPLIREPMLVKRWKAGDTSRSKCISCGKCLKNVFVHPLRCYAVY